MSIDMHGNYVVRTVVRSRYNGLLHVSSDQWRCAPDALEARGEYFRPVYTGEQRAILREYFGHLMPEYPGEWTDIRQVDGAARPPAIPMVARP